MSKEDLKDFIRLMAFVMIVALCIGLVGFTLSIDWQTTLAKVGIELKSEK